VALKKALYWTDLYYDVVEHYFWRPQDIGRKSDPDRPRRPWAHWKGKLESQETPLNHILDFVFHIVPPALLDRSIAALLQRPVAGCQLVAPTDGTIDDNIVQPDIIVSNHDSLIFVEMKVDSQSSIDQFAKYAIAAHCILRDEPQIKSVDLIVLSRRRDHMHVWKRARKLRLSSVEAIREVALRGLEGDPTIWKERSVPRYLKSNPDAAPLLAEQINTMGLHLADYSMLEHAMKDYAAQEKTVERLIEGVLQEFKRRDLLTR